MQLLKIETALTPASCLNLALYLSLLFDNIYIYVVLLWKKKKKSALEMLFSNFFLQLLMQEGDWYYVPIV